MLSDLDELVLRCRHDAAKAYISEAVACYKAGAYRASIISTWLAVTFDIVDKFRELSLTGDKAAEAITEEFDGITRTNDLSRSLKFERELLVNARDKFELISAQEMIDLERLQEDRHRSAHPSRSASMEIFKPTAELARTHIRSAVEHLLQHEPAQGKAALDTILKTIDSQYFPDAKDKALAVLEKSPLKRARKSLIRNLVIVLIKAYLKDERGDYKKRLHRGRALACIKDMHPELWWLTVKETLSQIVRSLHSEEELEMLVNLISMDPAFGQSLEDDQVHRVREFISHLPSGKVYLLSSTEILSNQEFKKAALDRASRLTVAEIADMEFLGIPMAAVDRIVSAFKASVNFEMANTWAKVLVSNVSDVTPAHVEQILQSALKNSQVSGSFGIRSVVAALEKADKIPATCKPLLEEVRNLIV